MGVNLVDYEQLKFPSIIEEYLFEEVDCDVPIKSSLVVEKAELYNVITSLGTDLNLD